MEPALSHLKLSQCLLICVALSTIGTILMVLAMTAYDDYRAGAFGHALSNPYSSIRIQLEIAAIFLCANLVANFLGAGALIAFFTLRRRFQRR